MASRLLRVAALLWVVGFFAVYVPAHRRGAVTHSPSGAASAAAYCPLCVLAPAADRSDLPPEAPAGCCAVCHLKANLDLPAVALLAPEFVDELEFLVAETRPTLAPLLARQHRLQGRAPPTAA